MRHLIAILAAGAFGTIGPSTSLNAQPHLTGAGAQSCADFVEKAGPDGLSEPAALQWALGYITGRASTPNTLHRAFTGPEGIAADLLAYCRKYPVHQIDDAAASYFERKRYCNSKRGCR